MSIKRFLIVVPVVRHCQSINSVRQKDYHKSFWKCTSLYTYRKPEANSGKSDKKCTRCGRSHHPRHQCPARNAICHSCNRKGHFKSQYFSKTNSKSVVQIIQVWKQLVSVKLTEDSMEQIENHYKYYVSSNILSLTRNSHVHRPSMQSSKCHIICLNYQQLKHCRCSHQ